MKLCELHTNVSADICARYACPPARDVEQWGATVRMRTAWVPP